MQTHENDFLRAFKLQMITLQQEYQKMKLKMDEQLLKEKKDWKMKSLNKQLEYFRSQALWLEQLRKSKIKIKRTTKGNKKFKRKSLCFGIG